MSALATAIVHSVWFATLVVGVTGGLRALARTPAMRHAIGLVGLATIVLGFVATWIGAWISGAGQAPLVSRGSVTSLHGLAALLPWIPWLWSIGVTIATLRLVGGVWTLHRWRRKALPLPEALRADLQALALRLGVPMPWVAVSRRVPGPLLVGLVRPWILLPATLVARVDVAVIEAALAHELAHLRRRDPWWNALQQVADVLLFHHPCVWWLSARIREDREAACDDAVIAHGLDPFDYAHGLTELEALRGNFTPALAATGGSLVSRIHRIVLPAPERRVRAAVVPVLILATLGLGACLALESEPEPSPSRAAAVEPRLEEVATPVPTASLSTVPGLPAEVRTHEAQILAAATQHGVAPELVAIITWVESGGDADARSPLGARGLMQLMPATAASIAAARHLEGHDASRLDDPAYNLDLGTYHLADLIQRHGAGKSPDEIVELAAVAYNGGSRRLEQWLAGQPLPEETERYREAVLDRWATVTAARVVASPPSGATPTTTLR